MATDSRVDDYIARQADFARPMLERIRAAMHAASPQIDEALKWGMPAFMYKGRLVAGMAAFKAHATLGFWNRSDVRGEEAKPGAMGDFGRMTSLADLPAEAELIALVHKATALIDAGAKPVREKTAKAPPDMPDDLAAALAGNPAAQATYDGFPPSCRREYLEWVLEAKRPETRARRIAQAVELMAEGKKKHWRYQS